MSTEKFGGASFSGLFTDVYEVAPHLGFAFDNAGIIDGIYDTEVSTNTQPINSGTMSFLYFGDFNGVGLSMIWRENNRVYAPNNITAAGVREHVSTSPMAGHWEYASVPAPSIIALFAAGLFGIGFARRRQS